MVGQRRELVVAMDWTDFDDDQTTLVFSLVTKHGRATPLSWFSVFQAQLTGKRNDIEDTRQPLQVCAARGQKVTILADRGFGDGKLFRFLGELGFAYGSAFAGMFVTAVDGERCAEDWLAPWVGCAATKVARAGHFKLAPEVRAFASSGQPTQ